MSQVRSLICFDKPKSKQMKHLILAVSGLLLLACNKEKLPNGVNLSPEIQEDVLTKEGIENALSHLEIVPYAELDSQYIHYSHPNEKFLDELKNRTYYKVFGNQMNLKIIGNYTTSDFMAHDEYYKTYKKNPFPEFEQYWLIDKEVLFMLLELILKLDEEGYNKYGFHIRNSHRHPKLNTDGSGASYSQHMFGRAIDIGIDDIDMDGESTLQDKKIIYDMLQKIVGNDGGLGLYPGKMSLHFDCRGFRARWDWP
ncbi:MAG: hypothetical protein BM555_06925 [Crocinitomix sp. MedPE-SWsnd]|nr:MAG: hypothetical protein BM555_06925 [Crocinitomix sp. MedPE-SWsnd]